jgi:multiple sugar transport system substrate-binding protein
MATKEPTLKGWASFANFDEVFTMPPVPDTLISVEGLTYREVMVNLWANPAKDDVAAVLADCDARYNAALAEADPATVAMYCLPEGVTAVAGK